jgi:hypothetical protein
MTWMEDAGKRGGCLRSEAVAVDRRGERRVVGSKVLQNFNYRISFGDARGGIGCRTGWHAYCNLTFEREVVNAIYRYAKVNRTNELVQNVDIF